MRIWPLFRRWVLGLALVSGALAASPSGPERKVFQFGEFVIEASAGDEGVVEALALKLADFRPVSGPRTGPVLTPAELWQRRDEFLGRAAARIGLAHPVEPMAGVFEAVLGPWRDFRGQAAPRLPHRFALWRSSDPAAGAAGAGVVFHFENENGAPADALAAAWERAVCPLILRGPVDAIPADAIGAELEKAVADANESLARAVDDWERRTVFRALHEVVQAGIVGQYLRSPDRQWFCSGVASYAAEDILRAEVGPEQAHRYADPAAASLVSGAAGTAVDLAAWPARERFSGAIAAEDLHASNYALAAKIIAEACRGRGDGFLARWFGEIGRTRMDKATLATVYKAYRRLTGDDLRTLLPPVAKAAGTGAKAGRR